MVIPIYVSQEKSMSLRRVEAVDRLKAEVDRAWRERAPNMMAEERSLCRDRSRRGMLGNGWGMGSVGITVYVVLETLRSGSGAPGRVWLGHRVPGSSLNPYHRALSLFLTGLAPAARSSAG